VNIIIYFGCNINNVDANIYFKCLNGGYISNKLESGHNISDV